MFALDYDMHKSPVPPPSWIEYERMVRGEWETLLGRTGTTEKDFQQFLEMHPCLLHMQVRPFQQGDSNPLSRAVVAQPELPGLKSKIPDFLYFTGDSGEISALLIEIESPHKKWFTAGGQPTADLTQASHQLAEWKAWFSHAANLAIFERDYLVRDYGMLADRHFIQRYALVVGRRKDLTSKAAKSQRKFIERDREAWMTYDRLSPSHEFEDAVTVKLDRTGPDPAFRVTHVTPTLRVGPHHICGQSGLLGLEDAIQSNAFMSRERKEFLIERLAYWRTWYGKHRGFTTLAGGDALGE